MRLLCLGLVVGLAVFPSLGAAASSHGRLALHLRWRLVTARANDVAASDRYAAVIDDRYPRPSVLTLIDQQTGRRHTLAAPGCSRPLGPMFGGPWLFVTCSLRSYEMYNLTARQWVHVALSGQCQGSCAPVAVGRYWIKIDTDEGAACGEHCGNNYFLQSIATGQFKPDPVTPGGRTFDDLNAPSGSVPLCAPLRYPQFDNPADEEREPGRLTFDGQFAIAERGQLIPPYTLERCHSTLRLSETQSSTANGPAVLSSRAMAWTYLIHGAPRGSFGLAGWLLPSVQRFNAALPAPLREKGAVIVALGARTVYVSAAGGSRQLWTAQLPARTKPRKHP